MPERIDGPSGTTPAARPVADDQRATTPRGRTELVGFLAIGALSYVVDTGLLWLLSGPGHVDVRLAATVGFWTSVLVNFTLNRWLFHRAAGGTLRRHTVRYAVLLGVAYAVTLVGLSAAEHAGVNLILAKTALTAVIAVWNFVLYRTWVFR